MGKTVIIAEAGVNHNGDINIAKNLIKQASLIGADYIKFQTFRAENIVTRFAQQASYQIKNTGLKQSQFQMIKELEISYEDHFILIEECKLNKIGFLSSAFDLESIKFLNSLNLDYFKVPSGEITNLPYLRLISTFKRPVILSTGMASLGEIELGVETLIKNGLKRNKINILHCSTEYPAPKENVNLSFISTLKKTFGLNVGYSDHTKGIEVALAAVALGANIIEKHLTLDRNYKGPDHMASMEPKEFKEMIENIRSIEKALGNGLKKISVLEKNNAKAARKSLVANKKIIKGETFTEENVTCKRPGTGISPIYIDEFLGNKAGRDYLEDELIERNFYE